MKTWSRCLSPRKSYIWVNYLLETEGVFLWVSLVLRLLERGLLEEDSVEDPKSSIDVLPTKVEKLFQVTFDSIKNEPNTAKRRKALRILSLANDEAELTAWSGSLYPLHLSGMEDYDREHFVGSLRGGLNKSEMGKRLLRCQKQLDWGCREFLRTTSVIWDLSDDHFRKYCVTLAHRSLIEFLHKPDGRASIEEHSQDFIQ